MAASVLKIGGELVANSILLRVDVTQELNEHDWCEVEMRQTTDARPMLEESLGKELQITTQDEGGGQRVIFQGFILETELEYELTGSFTARLKGVSLSYKLDCTAQESYFRKKTLADVAQSLAGDDQLAAKVNCAARPPRNYVQWGETDFSFLKRIADEHHAWIRPTPQGIEINDKFQTGTPLTWRTEEGLFSFKMKGRMGQPAFQGTHYNSRSMQSNTLKKIQKKGDFTGASDRMVKAVHQASQALPPGHVEHDGRAATKDEFQQALERESLRAVAGSITGYGVSRVERVRAGDTVQIQGTIDARGSYGVTKVIHHWTQQGYRNEFWCTPWQSYLSPEAPRPKLMTGVVTGRVKDHNDPRHMGRLQIQYDWQEEGASAWARMATPHAGGGRGFLFLPEIGDEVLVAFENGDPERPVILGSLWNGVDKAPRQEFWGGDVAPNDIKRIVTKSGHRIQLSDKEGKEAIVIATPNKLKVSLLEKTDETGRPMILLHAADGDLVLSAPNGRIHFHSKYYSRETGDGGGEGRSSAGTSARTSAALAGDSIAPVGSAAPPGIPGTLSLGPNEQYRKDIEDAAKRKNMDPAALAALIGAEAAKDKHGVWNPSSRAKPPSKSTAVGLTQFTQGTWKRMALKNGTALNQAAVEKKLIRKKKNGQYEVAPPKKANTKKLLDLRTDPKLSIESAADYGDENLDYMKKAGKVPADATDDQKARLMYLAHHEGGPGAVDFLDNNIGEENAGSKLKKQVGGDKADTLIGQQGDSKNPNEQAYHGWLNGYMDQKIQPDRYRTPDPAQASQAPAATSAEPAKPQQPEAPSTDIDITGGMGPKW